MNRKQFLSGIVPLVAAPVFVPVKLQLSEEPWAVPKTPPFLAKGDTIGICCVAGYIKSEDIQPAVNKLLEWGYSVKIGETIGKRDFTLGGTDADRLHDFQQMLDNELIKAILCARGGYGTIRIIDKIDFQKFWKRPKWIIGFSDVTVLHSHIHSQSGIVTLHSKMCNSFPKIWAEAEPVQIETIQSINKCLLGEKMQYSTPANMSNRPGTAEGILVGGNLKTLENLTGSKSDISTTGKILFVEDTDEYMYSIDRMFWNLKRTGKLDNLKALIIGGFKVKKEDTPDEDFGRTLEQIVLEKVKKYKYPVCFDFPVGHQKNNFALKCGLKHKIIVNQSGTLLRES